jgi:hypothetical protein
MSAGSQMILQVPRHGVGIVRDEDTLLAFGPQQQGWIVAAQRQIGRVADAHRVQGINPRIIVPLNGAPKRTAQMLIEEVPERHASSTLLRLPRFHATP